jgi:chromosomal replication initiation ATPase DnaA
MGRAWRIEYEGALYHLMSRGNDGQDIYLNDADRNLFLDTISEMSERFEVDVFAYVLMPNHYHQQKGLAKDIDIDDVLKKSAKILQIDLDKCIQAKRLHGIDQHKRDLIVYFLWNRGIMTNEQLGRIFDISHSGVSHSAKRFKKKMINDEKVKKQFDKFNSYFNL